MTTLILLRHGETDWNHARRIQGATDVPLNDTGRQQARDAAATLRDTLDERIPAVVVASDLSRARETAEIIARELGLAAPRLYPELRERAYGVAEGLSVDEYFERWGDWHGTDVPEAETREDLRARAIQGLEKVARDVRRATAPGAASVIVVTHGALIREVIRHASGDTLPLEGEKLANASAHTVLFERDHLRLLSYTPHAA
ncbi:histidine phosphatase family protein [Microbacterium sp. 4R-513]|uniref:histidine phosphatase family protein n=1 Tax=Microbacterium sp. 4R-513 TaxID=2567934 RepID=UPI0013E1D044|nr:histidine phosphatase family protein [Microbacterium sp. 4R-513]QIG40775.1 histidine phosphatase family protein [Microbacterium sp. 4R-513]